MMLAAIEGGNTGGIGQVAGGELKGSGTGAPFGLNSQSRSPTNIGRGAKIPKFE